MWFKELLLLLGVIPIIFSQREEQDSSCDGASECLPASQCDSYMDESEKLKNLQKRTQEYNKLLTKLRGLVCNKKQKKICCSDTDDGPTILCGSRSDDTDEARISGGETVYPGKYPWMAAIFEDGKMHCGGTLISNRHILTAAHCVIDMGKRETKTEFDIRLGETDLKTKYDCRLQDISRCQDSKICYQRGNCAEPHISRGAKSVHVNPNYKVDDIHNNDLAVITLDRRVVFSNTVVAVCLPTPSQTTKLLELSPHSLLFVSGWGKMSDDVPLATVLQELQVSIVPHRKCGVTWSLDIDESLVCVNRYDGLGSVCQGDSGGPLVTISPQGEFVQAAVVHAGDLFCGEGAKPTLFTIINQERLEWIYQVIDSSK